MTDPFSQPYVFPGAERPERPRPLIGRIIAWCAAVLGALVLLASIADFSLPGIVFGLCVAASGALYLIVKPSHGRVVWATPALAAIPALVAVGIVAPTAHSEDVPAPAAFAAPAIAEVSPTTTRPTTTRPTTTTPTATVAPTTTAPTTTLAPAPETVTVYAPPPTTTVPYVPEPAPVYIAEPEPEYVPPAPAAAAVPSYVSYANCAAVRAAGAAPIYAGDPGYSSKLDRDGDGVGCEN